MKHFIVVKRSFLLSKDACFETFNRSAFSNHRPSVYISAHAFEQKRRNKTSGKLKCWKSCRCHLCYKRQNAQVNYRVDGVRQLASVLSVMSFVFVFVSFYFAFLCFASLCFAIAHEEKPQTFKTLKSDIRF